MAINFPNSPTNGDIYGNFTYDTSIPGWRKTPENSASLPAGTIVQWPGATAPANWLICDGSAVSRTAYASLFSAIGVQYGAGDGTTTFNLPDIPRGGDASGVVGVTRVNSQVTVTTTMADLSGITTTVALKAGRTYKISFSSPNLNSSSNTRARFDFYVNNSEIDRAYIALATGLGGVVFNIPTLYSPLSDGVYTIKMRGMVDVGTASMTVYGDAYSSTFLMVEDLGETSSSTRTYNIIKTSAGVTSGDSELAARVGAVEAANNATPLSPNYVINGGFDIWQRGTTFSYTSPTIIYTADRWSITNAGGSGTPGFTISRQSGANTPSRYCLRFQRNANNTATTFGYLAYSFESADSVIAAGKQVTLSFYARSGANYSPASSVLNFRLVTGTGTDQSLNNTGFTGQVNTDSTATLSTSWQRYSLTITAPSNTNQLGVQLWSQFTGTAGAADYYEITGVQVEHGAYATPFRCNAPSIQAELAACQRYFIRMYDPPLRGVVGGGGGVNRAGMVLPTEMRAAPSSSFAGTLYFWDGTNNSSISSLSAQYTQTSSVEYDLSMSNANLALGRGTSLYKGGGGYFDWSAEL